MSPTPTGRLHGTDLVLTRTFRAPVADVWASLTESERTARWYGPWQGDAAPGSTIKVQMAYEDGEPWIDMTIDVCDPPHRLALSAVDDYGSWFLEMVLTGSEAGTELRFTHKLTDTDGVGEFGPGWEYYLDALTASRDGEPMPSFDDYYPAMKPYFEAQRGQ
jgi:uncharacterized protein YndB with AHSA1/START domain